MGEVGSAGDQSRTLVTERQVKHLEKMTDYKSYAKVKLFKQE